MVNYRNMYSLSHKSWEGFISPISRALIPTHLSDKKAYIGAFSTP